MSEQNVTVQQHMVRLRNIVAWPHERITEHEQANRLQDCAHHWRVIGDLLDQIDALEHEQARSASECG